jgi:SAM-dependent methyltransferase
MIHYHQDVDPIGQIRLTGNDAVDARIRQANAAMAEVWHEGFPNATFWEWRYRCDPDLGSGVGSRGNSLSDKRALLVSLVTAVRPASVLDVGCGDGEAVRELPLDGYVGLDLSSAAVATASRANPDRTYLVGTLHEHQVSADLTLCQDVLIHQATAEEYRALVGALIRSARRALLVSGYEHAPTGDSPMVHFHEPLSVTIAGHDPQLSMHPLRVDYDVTTFLVFPPDTDAALVTWAERHRAARSRREPSGRARRALSRLRTRPVS